MYKDVKFERREIEEVKKDIDTAQQFAGGNIDKVFIGDSDSLIINTKAICEILEHLYNKFPSIVRVTSYARSQTLKRKSADDLKSIRDAGLSRLHIGLETGNAHLLKKMRKGSGPETMIAGGVKAREAGFEVSLYVLLGMGGATNWSGHASDTARVINRMAPDFIRVRTLTPQPGTRVYRWCEDGSFKMQNPEGILKEQRRLIENLNLDCEYLSDHVSNYAPVNGMLPGDKPAMLAMIDNTLERLTTDHEFKCALEKMPFLRRL